eukprot:CAMPEP_0170261288 /NCGR_PEP_ID=MMETSP0116_2-20130129/30524_1 /TAXON_ID=400756 /ORGANISM="Durinskia baltica, Strain CSIRO CS-38" /LENGTH=414 /DNA_ID=CAMNT_0010512351 /DNA_START=202 /DNA_END=1445 /DNA_ORIENTATION=-
MANIGRTAALPQEPSALRQPDADGGKATAAAIGRAKLAEGAGRHPASAPSESPKPGTSARHLGLLVLAWLLDALFVLQAFHQGPGFRQLLMHLVQLLDELLGVLLGVVELALARLVRLRDQAMPDADEAPAARQDQDLGRVEDMRELQAVAPLDGQGDDDDDEVQQYHEFFQKPPRKANIKPISSKRKVDKTQMVIQKQSSCTMWTVSYLWGSQPACQDSAGKSPSAQELWCPWPDKRLEDLRAVCRDRAAAHGVALDELAMRVVGLKEELDDHAKHVDHQEHAKDQLHDGSVDEMDELHLPRVMAEALLQLRHLVVAVHERGPNGRRAVRHEGVLRGRQLVQLLGECLDLLARLDPTRLPCLVLTKCGVARAAAFDMLAATFIARGGCLASPSRAIGKRWLPVRPGAQAPLAD